MTNWGETSKSASVYLLAPSFLSAFVYSQTLPIVLFQCMYNTFKSPTICVCTSVIKTSFGYWDHSLSKRASISQQLRMFLLHLYAHRWWFERMFLERAKLPLHQRRLGKLCYYMLHHISEAILLRPWASSVESSIYRLYNSALRGL